MHDATKREQLREKVLTAQARNARRQALAARDNVKDFVTVHPFASLAGAVAAGVLIGALFPRSLGRKLGKGTAGVATLAAKLGTSYARHAWQAAKEARQATAERVEQLDGALMDRTSGLRHDVRQIAEKASDGTRGAGKAVTRRASRMADLITSRTRH